MWENTVRKEVAFEASSKEWAFLVVLEVSSQVLPACQCKKLKRRGFNPGLGRSPGGGYDNPLQYSCQENPIDRGAWWAMVHRVAELDMTEVT